MRDGRAVVSSACFALVTAASLESLISWFTFSTCSVFVIPLVLSCCLLMHSISWISWFTSSNHSVFVNPLSYVACSCTASLP